MNALVALGSEKYGANAAGQGFQNAHIIYTWGVWEKLCIQSDYTWVAGNHGYLFCDEVEF